MVPVPDFSSLEGRVVLITGGAGHIGSVLADGFLAVGCSVATADLTDPEHPVSRDTARFMHTTVDLTDTGSSAALVDETVKRFGRLDVVVTTASWMGTDATPGWNAPFAEQDEGLWPEVLQVGVTSVFGLVQHAAPHLANSSDGSVVLLSSIYGFCAPQPAMYEGTGINNIAGYAASKGAVGQLARWLSTTLAPDVQRASWRSMSLTPTEVPSGWPGSGGQRREAHNLCTPPTSRRIWNHYRINLIWQSCPPPLPSVLMWWSNSAGVRKWGHGCSRRSLPRVTMASIGSRPQSVIQHAPGSTHGPEPHHGFGRFATG